MWHFLGNLTWHHGIAGPVMTLALLGALVILAGFALTIPIFMVRHLGRGFRKGFSEKSSDRA